MTTTSGRQPLLAGLCSVTLRHLHADAVVEHATAARLNAIEWGGDVHVPPGETGRATTLAKRCADAGLDCPSYGSYLFAGRSSEAEIEASLDTAEALGVSLVRVWAGRRVQEPVPAEDRQPVIDALELIASRAAARSLAVGVESHWGTFTATATATIALLGAVGAPNLFTYWQPTADHTNAHSLVEYQAVADNCCHLHVFWWASRGDRRPLTEGESLWLPVLRDRTRRRTRGPPVPAAYLELVRDDDPHQLRRDANTLRRWLETVRRGDNA